MADRVFSYEFRAKFGQFQAQLAAGGKSVQDFGTKLTALDKQGARMRAGLDTLGGAAGKLGLAAGVGFGASIAAAANFDQAMSNIQAATHETATNMGAMRKAALEAGASTVFSATEAAGAVENLAKAGVSTKDILGGGLSGALDLAAAGELDVASAAEIAATALTQFNLAGEDVPHVADLLAAGAGKAQGEVTDLAAALNQSGLIASQTGLSIEETVGTLSAFASAGLLGSDAGTSFKTMLQSLTPTSKESARLMKKLGISAYDAHGNFIGMAEFAGVLQGALKGMSVEQQNAAMKTIFGADAVRAASVLFEQGSEGIEKWVGQVDESGYAAETARIKMDNLKGDLEGLKGALETALIGGGSGSQGALRGLTQDATAAVNVFNDLPPAMQSTTTAMLGITAITGGGLWFGSKVVTGIADTRQAMSDLGFATSETSRRMTLMRGAAFGAGGLAAGLSLMADESTNTGKAIEGLGLTAGGALMGFSVGGPIGAAVGAGIGGIGGLAKAMLETKGAAEKTGPSVDELAASFDGITGSATEATRALALQKLEAAGALAELRSVGIDQRDAVSATLGDEDAIRRVNEALRDAQDRVQALRDAGDWEGAMIADNLSADIEDAASKLRTLGFEMEDARGEAHATALATQELATILPGIPEKVLTRIEANGIPETRAEVMALVKEYDLTPKEKRTLMRVLDSDRARREIGTVIDEANKVPRSRNTHLSASGAEKAIRESRELAAAVASIDRSVTITVRKVGAGVSDMFAGAFGGKGAAAGGPVRHHGPTSIPAQLTQEVPA